MFQSYQSGPAVEVLNAKDKSPSLRFSSKVRAQVFEKAVKGFILSLESPGLKMTLPADDRHSLNLIQPYLVLQVWIDQGQSFSLELAITDSTNTKRRLMLSSASREMALTPLHARIPNKAMLRGVWMNLSIDLVSFTGRCFHGVTFRSLDAITVTSFCKLRRIFTMRSALWEDQGERVQGVTYEPVPKAYDFPPGVEVHCQLFHAGLIVTEEAEEAETAEIEAVKASVIAKAMPKITVQKKGKERTNARVLKSAVPGTVAKVPTRVPPGTAPLTGAPQSPASMRSSGLMFRSTLTGLSSQHSRYDLKPTGAEVEETIEEGLTEDTPPPQLPVIAIKEAPTADMNPWGPPSLKKSGLKSPEVPIPECIEEPSALPDIDFEENEENGALEEPPLSHSSEENPCDSPPNHDSPEDISGLSVRESIHLADSLDKRVDPDPYEDSLEMKSPAVVSCSSENPLDKVNSFRGNPSHPTSSRFNHRLQDQSAASIAEELDGAEAFEDSLDQREERKEITVPSYYRDAVDQATQFRPFTPPFAGVDKSRSFRKVEEESEEDEEEEVELVLDPVLGCYYDPKTHEYYELKE